MVSAVLLLASCQKDADVIEMSNSPIQLSFQMLDNTSVEVSRASEATESDVNDVMVYFFNEDYTKAIEPIYLKKESLTLTETGDYTRTYTATVHNASLKNGKYYIFAIANIETDMWKLSEANLDYSTYDKLVEALISASWTEPLGSNITLTGRSGSDGSAIVENGQLTSTIYLKRPYAKVNFNFKSGGDHIVFNADSYSIYNLPGKASIFQRDEKAVASNFWDSEGIAFSTQTPNTFSFYQLENQHSTTGINAYHNRANNAPENATYVVVNGQYKEYKLDENGNPTTALKYSGDVSYKIHLGDFSANNGNDYNDFNILRNTNYNYNVTINGVNKIIVEAKKENETYENGAEGYIIDASQSKMIYTLDAHYETVQLRIPVDGLFDSGDASRSLNISVSTPMMPEENCNTMIDWNVINNSDMTDEAFYAKYDLKWVEFVPCENDTFATYPGQGKALYIRDFVKELYEAIQNGKTDVIKIKEENGERVIYATCFVNEYYYDGEPWPKFVGQPNRTLNFLQSPEISADKNSIYAQTLFSFSQKSIETAFKYDASINGFGMETYDESGALILHPDFNGLDKNDVESNGTVLTSKAKDAYNGRDNMIAQVGITTGSSQWETYMSENGYSYEGQEEMTYTKMNDTYNYAYAACMQRNRDLDGKGYIDDGEIRWYLAAVNQYRTMWLGEKGYPASSALFTMDLSNITSAEYDWVDHYYTNSDWQNRIFWAIEGGSTGPYSPALNQSYDNGGYMNPTQRIRCVRNLSKVESATTEMATEGEWYWDSENAGALYIASNLSDKAVRNLGKVGEYAAHNERDAHNALPKAFVMAKNNLERELNRTENTVTTYTQVGAPQIASATYQTTLSSVASPQLTSVSGETTGTEDIEVTINTATSTRTGNYGSYQYTFTLTLNKELPAGVTMYWSTRDNTSGTNTMSVNGTTATNPTTTSSTTIYVWIKNSDGTASNTATIQRSSWYSSTTTVSNGTLTIAGTLAVSSYTATISNHNSACSYYWTTANTFATTNKIASATFTVPTDATTIYVWAQRDGVTSAATTLRYQNGSFSSTTGSSTDATRTYYTVTLSNVASGKSYYWSSTAGANGKQVTPSNKVLTIETTASPIYIWCTVNSNGTTMKSESSSVTSAGVITNSSVVDDIVDTKTTTTYTVGSTITIYNSKNGSGITSEDNYCAQHYYENDDYSDLGKWRVPNQRELIVMSMYSNLSPSDSNNASDYYLSRTQPSVSDIYSARGMHLYYNTACRLSWSPNANSVRCVRDATADEVAAKMPEDKEYDSEFEDNGDAI